MPAKLVWSVLAALQDKRQIAILISLKNIHFELTYLNFHLSLPTNIQQCPHVNEVL